MKVMHIAGGGDRGGAKPHIITLCSELMKTRELVLVSLRTGEFADEARAAGIHVKTIYSRFVLRDYWRLIREVGRYQPDIVHCHGAKANAAGMLIKLFCRRTIVTTIHSDYKLDYMNSFIKRNTIGRLNAASLRCFDYYVTVSDTFKKMMITRGFSPRKLMPIYNGVDFSIKAAPMDRAPYLRALGLDYRDGDVVLGIPARLTPVKDIPTLLQAFAQARRSNPRLKLLIGGDGEERDALEGLSRRLGIADSVCFCGWVDDVGRFFASCDIDVLCSISETFPYSILEGVRERCAVVSSDVGGVRALIDHGENGYIFSPGDADALAGYILDLAGDGEKRALFADRLYEKATRAFSLKAMTDTQSAIYERVLRLRERAKMRDGVLICGAYGKGNSGDEAILMAIIRSMREIDPEIAIKVMTRSPQETRLLYSVDSMYTFNAFSFLRAMKHARLYVNGGGSLIQDVTSSRSLYFYLYTIRAAKKRGCRVIMYGCGIGHVRRARNRRLASHVLNRHVDIITLRDKLSVRELSEMGITKPDIRLSSDPAITIAPASPACADALLAAQGVAPDGKYICFALRSWKSFTHFDYFAKAAEHAYRRYGLTAVFMPIEQPRDVPPSKLAASYLSTPYHIVNAPDNVSQTIAILKKMNIVCAMRLHALVFAAAAGVPFIATAYDIKVSGFMEYVGSSSCCALSELTPEWLCEHIDRALLDLESTKISARLSELEKENLRAARELLEA